MFSIILLTLSIITVVLGLFANYLRKRRMHKALGREIKPSDLTSINTWIEVQENEDIRRSEIAK
jgi:hypothetical protein